MLTRLAGLLGAYVPAGLLTVAGPLRTWSQARELPRPAGPTLHELLRDRPSE
jgi:hypothetical protein